MPAGSESAFHEVLRAAIDRRGLPLERVAAHLRSRGHTISIATLSYWQSGRSAPSRSTSLRALGALEQILDVPRGELARHVPTPPAAPAAKAPLAMADVSVQTALLDSLARELALSWDEGLETISLQARYFVDETGHATHLHSRETVLVTKPGALHAIGAFHPAKGVHIEISALLGCAVACSAARVEDSVCVAGLRFPAVRAGSPHVIEFEIAYDTSGLTLPPHDHGLLGIVSPAREAYLEINFTPGAIPRTVRAIERVGDATTVAPLELTHPTVAIGRAPFGPGEIVIEWDLPGDGIGHS